MLKLKVLLKWQILISMVIFEEKSSKLWSTFFFAIQQNPNRKMINLLTFDNLFPRHYDNLTKLLVEWRRLLRLPAKIVSLRNRTAGRRGWQNACVWRTWRGCNLRVLSWSWLTSIFSGLLQKDLFKRKWSLAKSYFKQNYCHVCHTRFAVFFPLPSCCVSSLNAGSRARST